MELISELNKHLKEDKDIMFRFKLRLNIEKFGKYVKGDEDTFYIKLKDAQNGLVRYPIDEKWDIISCEVDRLL